MRRRPLAFDPSRLIESEKLSELKQLCLRAPSSYNSQPFRCVLVDRDDVKDDLAHCMIGVKNARHILSAPITAVFLADTESFKNSTLFKEHLHQNETFQQRKRRYDNQAFISGSHGSALRKIVESFSSLAPIQIPEDPTVWAVKQTCFFGDHWLLACAGLGLSSYVMEGFDERRVRHVVGASDRYYCPFVIATGYSKDPIADLPETPRLNPDEVFFANRLA